MSSRRGTRRRHTSRWNPANRRSCKPRRPGWSCQEPLAHRSTPACPRRRAGHSTRRSLGGRRTKLGLLNVQLTSVGVGGDGAGPPPLPRIAPHTAAHDRNNHQENDHGGNLHTRRRRYHGSSGGVGVAAIFAPSVSGAYSPAVNSCVAVILGRLSRVPCDALMSSKSGHHAHSPVR